MTYRAVSSLLAQMPLPVLAQTLFSGFHLPNAGVHALGHVLLGSALWPGNEEELKLQLTDLVRRSANDGCVATLALDARSESSLFSSPLVEGGNVGQVRPAEALGLVLLQADVGASETAVFSGERREEVPGGRMGIHLPSLGVAVLLSESLLFFLGAELHLLALLGRREHTAERRRLGSADLGGRWHNLLRFWLLQLHIQGKLELEVAWHDQLELLSDGCVASQLKPGGGDAVHAVIQRQAEPSSLI